MKKKQKKINRKSLYISLALIVIFIVSLSIVYAALSKTLTISGSGIVNASNWSIGITNLTVLERTGSATYTKPTITGTTIGNYTVSLTKPGDSVTLGFRVYNNGTLNGEISSIINSTPICTSSTGNANDESLVCDNLDISLDYMIPSETISVGDVIIPNGYYCLNGSSTSSGNYANLRLTVSIPETMTSVSSSNVTISNLRHEIIYVQTDKTCVLRGGAAD